MNAFARAQLEVGPSDRILEIGFGGGVNLPSLIEIACFVAGVDSSRDVVRRAGARFRAAVIATAPSSGPAARRRSRSSG
jgi:cyclopropane fatty-acyl-phospholipid synthase-like methyltransferase